MIDKLSNIEELTEEICSLEEIIKGELIDFIEFKIAWARQRYVDGGPDYAERIEFADYYFKLSDILEELHRYEVGGIAILKFEMERAYSDLRESVYINEQLELF